MMIKLSVIDKSGENHTHILNPTIFPDGTSQVWKLPEVLLKKTVFPVIIEWAFYNEAEFLHLAQLKDLLSRYHNRDSIHLIITYLPYGRQDKDVSNENTFALNTFLKLLDTLNFETIIVNDPHNEDAEAWANLECEKVYFNHDVSFSRLEKIAENYDLIVYPDNGAVTKYHLDNGFEKLNLPMVTFDKVRDQSTGKITSIQINEEDSDYQRKECGGLFKTDIYVEDLKAKNIIIVDDICDGGRTFIGIAGRLRDIFPDCHITLYTTYGIYSHKNGKDHLFDNGIDMILCAYELTRDNKDE